MLLAGIHWAALRLYYLTKKVAKSNTHYATGERGSMVVVVQVSESEFSVQGHGVHTAFVETCNGLEAAGVKVVKNKLWQKADVRHIHTVGPYSLLHLIFGSGKKIISAHIVPASLVGSLKGADRWLAIATWYLRWFYNRAHTVVAVSDETKSTLLQMGVRRPIEVAYNMVNTKAYEHTAQERAAARKKLGINDNEIVVLGNGQVQPRKRADTFVAVAHQLPEMKFIWVGGMPFGKVAANATEMQAIIDNAPKNVHFTGVVDLPAVREYFIVGDIFFMPSMQETFGLAIVEAAAAGMPLVLRAIPDYDNTFKHDAVPCSEAEFVGAIKRLAHDAGYAREMTAKAKQLAARYDSQTIVHKLLEVYGVAR